VYRSPARITTSLSGQIKADEIKNKIKKNPQWTETCQVLEGTPTDAGLQGFISFVSSKWEEFAEAVGISQQKSQTKFEVLQEWRDAEYPTHWEFLMDNIKALSTLSPNKVAEIDDKIKNDPNWSDYSPFRNKATSEALNWTSDNVWSRSDKVQTCSSYHKWLENMVKDNEFTDDIYGREKVALCGLNWFRNKYKEDNKIAMSEAIPPFSEDIDRPQDLFAIIAYKFGFEDSDYIKYTLFAALLHELHGKKFDTSTFFYGDYHVLHFACYCGKRRIVQLLMDWGVDADVRSPYSGMNALHIACGSNFVTNHYASFHIQMVDLLIENGANLFAETTDEGWVPLFKAIYAQKQELVQHLLKKYADLEVCNVLLLLQQHDSEGNTALHLAARINNLVIVKQICSYAHKADEQQAERTKKPVTSQESVWFQLLTAENDAEQTPIHFAAKHTEECLKEMIERQNIGSHLAFWCAKEDTYGKCPLDYAAETAHKTTFEVLWKYVKACSPPQVASVGLDIKQLVRKKDIDWTLVKHRLQDIPSALIPTIVEETAGALEVSKNYKHKSPHQDLSLHEILRASPGARPKEHLDVVTEFLDATVFGDQVVLGKTFDSDVHGIYDETSVHRSLTLHALLTTDLPVWGHPAIKGWIRNKIHTFKPGWWILMLHLVFYLIFLGSLIGALYLAARPEISEVELLQQYIGTVQLEPEDMGRIFLESMVLLYTLGMLCQVISDFCGLAHHYFKLFTVYLRIVLVALVIALIICRAAASQGQWIVASLLFLTAVFLSTDYLIIFRFCNVYVLALWVIVRRDVLRFLVIATILTFAFSGGLYFALRAKQAPPNTTSAVVCVSTNSTDGNNSVNCVPNDALTNVSPKEIFSLEKLLLANVQTVTEGSTIIPLEKLLLANVQTVTEGSTIIPLEKLLLANVQTVTEGSTITYDVYHIYTILLYLSFVVIILLLMINALIAQISHSYNEAQEQAAQMSTYATARFLMITYPVCPWCIPPGHSNSEEDSNYYSGNWKCLKYLNYRRMACKCISGSEEIIWIKDSILKESQHNGMCCKFLKRFLRSVMIVLRAIFGAEGAVVAKTTSTINKDQCGNMIAMKRFDSLTNLMKEQQGIHMAHVSPQEVAINIDN
jgi:ankyrin repeat protein